MELLLAIPLHFPPLSWLPRANVGPPLGPGSGRPGRCSPRSVACGHKWRGPLRDTCHPRWVAHTIPPVPPREDSLRLAQAALSNAEDLRRWLHLDHRCAAVNVLGSLGVDHSADRQGSCGGGGIAGLMALSGGLMALSGGLMALSGGLNIGNPSLYPARSPRTLRSGRGGCCAAEVSGRDPRRHMS